MEVIVGTYEEFLVGFKLSKVKNEHSEDGEKAKYKLKQSFTNHAHCGSIRSVATSNKYLASGSVDEVVHLINMKHRIDKGSLSSHTGTINVLEFWRSSYLFSASDDGNIGVWNAKTWQCEKTLRGHKEAINGMSVHSSGKLLLSVSKDKTLRTWNLIKGRCAYIINLKEVAQQVLWSPSYANFAVVFDRRVDIYDLATGGVVHSIGQSHFDKKIMKIVFIDDSKLIIAGDCNFLLIYDIEKKAVIKQFTAHENRIKDLAWVSLRNLGDELIDQTKVDENDKWLVTISSDGFIKVWEFNFSKLSNDPKLISSIDTTCRPTCLAIYTPNNVEAKNWVVPELKISEEEMEVCKAKIMEKKSKKKSKRAQEEEGEDTQGEDEDEEIKAMTSQAKKKKFFHKSSKTSK